jgi:ribosomal protein S18 acetylase RimI-like enzyme
MIRKLTLADLDRLEPLFAAYLDFYRVRQPPQARRSFLASRLAANDSSAFGAFDEAGNMTGFALCHLAHNSLRLAPAWILHDLFVTPGQRRQGTARQLLEAVHTAARAAGACEVILSTAHDNTAAQSLYECAGYRLDKVFRTYVFDLR